MKLRSWLTAIAAAAPMIGAFPGLAWGEAGSAPTPSREMVLVGSLRAPEAGVARTQARAWLVSSKKDDERTLKAFDAIWSADDSLLDRVAATLALGDAEAAKVLAEARDPSKPGPMTVPAGVMDKKRPTYYRANLGLAFAKALSNRKVYEECLAALREVKPEQVVDPAAYFFHRAVAEHALTMKTEATRSIGGLLEDVSDTPDRYKMLALLMLHDMQSWQVKDLAAVARKMANIERRLELARGGPQTQKLQKQVVQRLDEMIKELESGGC